MLEGRADEIRHRGPKMKTAIALLPFMRSTMVWLPRLVSLLIFTFSSSNLPEPPPLFDTRAALFRYALPASPASPALPAPLNSPSSWASLNMCVISCRSSIVIPGCHTSKRRTTRAPPSGCSASGTCPFAVWCSSSWTYRTSWRYESSKTRLFPSSHCGSHRSHCRVIAHHIHMGRSLRYG